VTQSFDKPRNPQVGSGTAGTERIVAFSPMSEPTLKAFFDMGLEGLKLASTGLKKCVETQRAMLACRTFEDFQKVQADFYSSAFDDYRTQMARMMSPVSAAPNQGLGGTVTTAKRNYDDVPL
jgi:hypothetical protein